MATTILGIDPAVRHTGVARWRDGRLSTMTITPHESWGDEQAIRWTAAHIWPLLQTPQGRPDGNAFVVMENPFIGVNARVGMRLAGLSMYLRIGLWSRQVPFGMVPPATLKKFATGLGQCPKERMILAAQQAFNAPGNTMGPWRPLVDDHQHEADALHALHLGLVHKWQAEHRGRVERRRLLWPGVDDDQYATYLRLAQRQHWPDLEWEF